MKLRIFTVFHRSIDERLIFEQFSRAELDEYFSLYAVSERHPQKSLTRLDGTASSVTVSGPGVTFESQLRWYEPAIQARGFMETSCYIHVLKNELYASFDYIGVTQYDMRWKSAAAEIVRALAREGGEGVSRNYGFVAGTIINAAGQFSPVAYERQVNWNFLLDSYNRFFGKQWTLRMLVNKPFTLFQTYLLPRAEFVALAQWLTVLCDELYPWATEPPYETHWGALAGFTERAEAVFMAARLHEGLAELHTLPLEHDYGIAGQLDIQREHYLASPRAGSQSAD